MKMSLYFTCPDDDSVFSLINAASKADFEVQYYKSDDDSIKVGLEAIHVKVEKDLERYFYLIGEIIDSFKKEDLFYLPFLASGGRWFMRIELQESDPYLVIPRYAIDLMAHGYMGLIIRNES